MERSVIRGPASPRGTGCGEALPAFRFAPCGLREILFSLCQTANASPPVWPLPRPRRTGLRLSSLAPSKGERSAGEALVRPCDRPHLACLRGTLKDACEASPCPLRSGHSPCGAPLRPLRLHRPFSGRGRPSAGDEAARGSRPASALWLVSRKTPQIEAGRLTLEQNRNKVKKMEVYSPRRLLCPAARRAAHAVTPRPQQPALHADPNSVWKRSCEESRRPRGT